MNDLDIDINILPGILRDLVDLIGLPATMTIVQHKGGTGLWIPAQIETLAPDHKLVKAVGMEAAMKLSENYGGEELEIPKAEKAVMALRNKEIREKNQYMSQSQLALEYNLTERQIRTIVSVDVDENWPTLDFEKK